MLCLGIQVEASVQVFSTVKGCDGRHQPLKFRNFMVGLGWLLYHKYFSQTGFGCKWLKCGGYHKVLLAGLAFEELDLA